MTNGHMPVSESMLQSRPYDYGEYHHRHTSTPLLHWVAKLPLTSPQATSDRASMPLRWLDSILPLTVQWPGVVMEMRGGQVPSRTRQCDKRERQGRTTRGNDKVELLAHE